MNLRETGSVKILDVALMRLPSCKPIITAAVGLDRNLNELFEDTKQLLQGGLTRAVFIFKIYENEHAAPVNPPWKMSREGFQVDEVLAYHRIHDISLVGKLSADLYLWSSESPSPPHYPLWTFHCGHNTPEQPGIFNNTFSPLLDKDNHLRFLGGSYALPIKRLQENLQMAIECEAYSRACDCIYQNHVFSDMNRN